MGVAEAVADGFIVSKAAEQSAILGNRMGLDAGNPDAAAVAGLGFGTLGSAANKLTGAGLKAIGISGGAAAVASEMVGSAAEEFSTVKDLVQKWQGVDPSDGGQKLFQECPPSAVLKSCK